MKQKKLIIIFLCCILLIAGGLTYSIIHSNKKPSTVCKTTKPNKTTPPKTVAVSNAPITTGSNVPINTIGNTGGNILNRGLATQQGNRVYFNSNGLCTAMLDMKTGWRKITDGNPQYINVIGDWIYYTDDAWPYRIKTDGTNKSQILNEKIMFLTATSEYLYFVDFTGSFCRTDINGANKTKLSEDYCSFFYLDKDWIYINGYNFQEKAQYETVKMRHDGSNKTTLLKDNLNTFLVHNDILYYNFYKPNKLVKLNQKDKNPLTLNTNYVINTNLSKDYLFFVDNTLGLYKIKHDSTTISLVYNLLTLELRGSTSLVTIQDYILLFSEPFIYKITVDGKVEQIAK